MDDWGNLIGYLVQVRDRLHSYDPVVFPDTIPHVGATEEQLAAAEGRIGRPLDPLHRELLSYANGWPDFFQSVDLLSTEQIGSDGEWIVGHQLLEVLYESAGYPLDWPKLEDVYLMASKQGAGRTKMVVWRTGPTSPDGGHPVIWWDDADDDRFADVHEFLLAVIQYSKNRLIRAGGTLPEEG